MRVALRSWRRAWWSQLLPQAGMYVGARLPKDKARVVKDASVVQYYTRTWSPATAQPPAKECSGEIPLLRIQYGMPGDSTHQYGKERGPLHRLWDRVPTRHIA
ncbi:hypothetical protein BD779DRAFT_1481692 [Infundibulicybe gibba]|nr:hypothetical protein BD779DRAFT_1481692 [Infundibulicybe gibba]